MPGQIPYIPFVGSRKAQETPAPKRTKSVSGRQERFASGMPAETDRAFGFALMGKPAPAYRSIVPDRPSMGSFTHPVDVSRGKGRGRTRTFEYGPGKISIPYGPDPGKVSLAMHMPRPKTSAFTMEQKSSERLNTILETVGKILMEAQYSGEPESTDIAPPFPHLTPSGKKEARRMGIHVPRSILDAAMGKVKNPGKHTGLRSSHVYVSDLPTKETPGKGWSELMVKHGALP